MNWLEHYIRSSRPELFYKKGALRNFAKFTGKRLCQSLFFNKDAGLSHLKRDSGTGVFQWILRNFWEHLFLQNTSGGCFCYIHVLPYTKIHERGKVHSDFLSGYNWPINSQFECQKTCLFIFFVFAYN